MALSRREIQREKEGHRRQLHEKRKSAETKSVRSCRFALSHRLKQKKEICQSKSKKNTAKNRRVKESPVIPAMHDTPNIRSKGRKLCVALAFKGMKKNDALRKRHSMALKNGYREI